MPMPRFWDPLYFKSPFRKGVVHLTFDQVYEPIFQLFLLVQLSFGSEALLTRF